MSDDFLSRWSRLKKASAQSPPVEAGQGPAGLREQPAAAPGQHPAATATDSAPAPAQPEPLPPVESLSFDSDFTAFMKPEVGEVLKRQALKTLFQDPRFNVMDGLDVYIDDYSKADPLPEGWLEKMNQVARLGEYKAPEEEAPQPAPKVADEAQKVPRNEVLATAPPPPPSATPEAPAMPPRVTQSPSPE